MAEARRSNQLAESLAGVEGCVVPGSRIVEVKRPLPQRHPDLGVAAQIHAGVPELPDEVSMPLLNLHAVKAVVDRHDPLGGVETRSVCRRLAQIAVQDLSTFAGRRFNRRDPAIA